MSVNRNYSNTAVATTLSSAVNNSVQTLSVGGVSGFPVSYPYTLVLDEGTATEELVSVTAAVGTTLTVVRGVDGTSAASHSAGSSVRHAVSAQDFREPQEHIAASTGVHGILGAVVGTSDAQAMTHKDVSDPTNTFAPANIVPTGVVLPYSGASAPSGWLMADGSAVSRTTYAALFALHGTSFGAGDGSTTFNLPDMRGRSVLGAGTGSGLTARTRGQSGGSENSITVSHSHNHAHGASSGTVSNDHTHSGSTGGFSNDHAHALGISDAGGLGGGGSLVRKGGISGDVSGGSTANHSHAFSTGGISANHTHAITVNADATAAGSSGTGANMAPYLVLNHIIKV